MELNNPESITKALEGITKVFMLNPPGQNHTGRTLTDAIKSMFLNDAVKVSTLTLILIEIGTVKHIVKLSALGTEDDGGKFTWGIILVIPLSCSYI